MTLPSDKIGDKKQRFLISVLEDYSPVGSDDVGYAESPAGFNKAIECDPKWRATPHQILIIDRKPEEGALGMLRGLLDDSEVLSVLHRAGAVPQRLRNVLDKELGK